MKLIVGLGNPTDKYVGTRHNLGFEVVEKLGQKMEDGRWNMEVEDGGWKVEKKFKSQILKAGGLLLVKPQTYMNNSGLPVASISKFYKITSENIIVIHDDLDLLLGHIKIRLGGGTAGHHGVESIISSLGTDQFVRIKLGIGNEHSYPGRRSSFDGEKFVVESFLPGEKSQVKSMVKKATEAVEILLRQGLEAVQNRYN